MLVQKSMIAILNLTGNTNNIITKIVLQLKYSTQYGTIIDTIRHNPRFASFNY